MEIFFSVCLSVWLAGWLVLEGMGNFKCVGLTCDFMYEGRNMNMNEDFTFTRL